MTVSQLHAAAEPQNSLRRGAIAKGLMEWKPDCVRASPWSGSSGPDAASLVLLKAHALTTCLSAAFSEGEPTSEFNSLVDSYKALAMDGIGDLILLAKVLIDEA